MEYKIISTGSKGNAVVVDGRILIDCGVPFRRLESVYRDLDAVLLTHIHSDHFQPKTLAHLAAERPSLRFFACPWLGPDLQNAGVPLRQITITTPDRWYDTGYCFVKACETKHNVRNCCWHIWFNDGSKVFYATDMGNLNGITAPYYDLYLVEANYRDEEIQAKIAEKKVNGEYIYEKRVLRDHSPATVADSASSLRLPGISGNSSTSCKGRCWRCRSPARYPGAAWRPTTTFTRW